MVTVAIRRVVGAGCASAATFGLVVGTDGLRSRGSAGVVGADVVEVAGAKTWRRRPVGVPAALSRPCVGTWSTAMVEPPPRWRVVTLRRVNVPPPGER